VGTTLLDAFHGLFGFALGLGDCILGLHRRPRTFAIRTHVAHARGKVLERGCGGADITAFTVSLPCLTLPYFFVGQRVSSALGAAVKPASAHGGVSVSRA
jgi:hypothetical protein